MTTLMPQPIRSDLYPSSMSTSFGQRPLGEPNASLQAFAPRRSPGSPSKRPRLTLDTSELSSGIPSHATSLRLETLSVTSPTSRNTFQNTYHEAASQDNKPKKPQLWISPPQPITAQPMVSTPTRTTESETPLSGSFSATSIDSTSSMSSTDSTEDSNRPIPYRISFNLPSILKNSPIPRTKRLSKAMFPAQKRVTFCPTLTEEIRTSKFVLAHSDLDILETDMISARLPSSGLALKAAARQAVEDDSRPVSAPPALEIPTSIPEEQYKDEEDEAEYPKTPVAGRRKRQREWVWTLGDIESSQPESAPTAEEPTAVESSNKES